MSQFAELGLSHLTLDALNKKGFETYTPIQGKIIPLLLKDQCDIIGQAQTGTGKTAAFGLPLVEKVDEKNHQVQALVLVPTRELALQVSEELNSFKGKRKINIVPIYGGQSIVEQFRRLESGAQIVVGTPGRIIDHLERRKLKLNELRYLVLDEADEMLNMGFIEDVEMILEKTPEEKRMLLFSATMPKRLLQIAEKYMGKKEVINIQPTQMTTKLTEQIYFEVSPHNKFEALCRIIDMAEEFYGFIFCRTKVEVDEVTHHLIARGYAAEALHGDVSQAQREKILRKFKGPGGLNILVATDVAARGIDVQNITHVINYSLPANPESYVHRIGRTGRAGKMGIAITFVSPEEHRKLFFIKRITQADLKQASLPKAHDIIQAKIKRLQTDLGGIIADESHQKYFKVAELLENHHQGTALIAALLKFHYGTELETEHYRNIEEPARRRDKNSGERKERDFKRSRERDRGDRDRSYRDRDGGRGRNDDRERFKKKKRSFKESSRSER